MDQLWKDVDSLFMWIIIGWFFVEAVWPFKR